MEWPDGHQDTVVSLNIASHIYRMQGLRGIAVGAICFIPLPALADQQLDFVRSYIRMIPDYSRDRWRLMQLVC